MQANIVLEVSDSDSPAEGQGLGLRAPASSGKTCALEVEGGDGEAGDMTCAICLEEIVVEDLCVVKGCEHIYCGARTITHRGSSGAQSLFSTSLVFILCGAHNGWTLPQAHC